MRVLPVVLATVILAATPALARKLPPPNPNPQAEIDGQALKDHDRILSSDAFEGRAPGTPGEEKAVAYIAQQMEKAGLQPGNGTSWFQPVPLVETKLDPAMRFRFTGAHAPTLLYGRDIMVATKRTTPTVSVADSPVVFVGYGIHAPERGWDDYAGLDVRGKTVLVLVNDPDWRNPVGQGPFDGRAMTYYGRWDYKHDEAARRGAAAVLVIHQTQPAGYPWSVVTSSWTGPKVDAARDDHGQNRPAFEGWITGTAADQLLRIAGTSLALAEERASHPGFKAIYVPLTLSASSSNAVRNFTSRNVIGILPGRTRPNEYVIYTAHWDHLGHCPADARHDEICNGAIDNASGVAGLLALAKAQVAAGPANRSMLFLSITGEESGLLGSEYYATHPLYPLAMTVGGVNMDGLNTVGRTSDVVIIGAGKSELEPILTAAAARQSRRIEPEPTPEKGYYYRSDHFSFAKQGVPMLDASSGVDVRGKGKAFGQAARADYTAHRYHQPSDEYDPNWDWSGAIEDLALYFNVGRQLADSREWPNWYKTAEFRAARDTSRAGQPAVSAPGKHEDRKHKRTREERAGRDEGVPLPHP
jgi:Zn-dependent M28 family amino/carboxypeptidase